MIIENVVKVAPAEDTRFTVAHIQQYDEYGRELHMPAVVFVPVEACIYFISDFTIKVEG